MPKIETFDADGNPNGWVMPIWSGEEEPGLRPEQVYVTAIVPGGKKGPHLHMRRRGVFFCVSGRVLVRKNYDGQIIDKIIEPGGDYCFVPTGTPAALYNMGDTEALVVNLPNPAWSKADPDEHPVPVWVDPVEWTAR